MSAAKKLAGLKKLAAEDSGATDAERATAKKLIAEMEAKGVVDEPEPTRFRVGEPIYDVRWSRYDPAEEVQPTGEHKVAFDLLTAIFGEVMRVMQDDKLWEEFARKNGVESMSSAPPKKRKKQ